MIFTKMCSKYCKLLYIYIYIYYYFFFFAYCFLHIVKTTVEYGSMIAINFRHTQSMEDGECLEIVIISSGVEIINMTYYKGPEKQLKSNHLENVLTCYCFFTFKAM